MATGVKVYMHGFECKPCLQNLQVLPILQCWRSVTAGDACRFKMASLNKCLMCNEAFLLDVQHRQALCLPCGHTACRSCLSRMNSCNCPSCGAPFTSNVATMAPNFMLHQVLASPASVDGSVSCIKTSWKPL